jgi:CheY-like chemotaxis protein
MITPEELETTQPDILPPAKHLPEGAGNGRCVLLAEDDPALRRYLQVVLERAGYSVVSAADGLEAMKFLLSATVDVVVTDAVMPNLDGYQLCRFMRGSRHLSHLPIILLSALDPRNATHESENVDVFLSKPVSPEDLLNRIVELSHK